MGAKRPPALERRAYVEIDLELLQSTGDIRIISAPIIAPTITQKVPRGKFEVTYTAELFGLLEKLGNKKIEVFSYLLDKKDGNNCINTTIRNIAEDTHTSLQTVQSTINILRDSGLIARKGSVYMISPNLMVKGNQVREAWLMQKYEELSDNAFNAYQDAIDVDVDPQYSFDEKMEVIQRSTEAPRRK